MIIHVVTGHSREVCLLPGEKKDIFQVPKNGKARNEQDPRDPKALADNPGHCPGATRSTCMRYKHHHGEQHTITYQEEHDINREREPRGPQRIGAQSSEHHAVGDAYPNRS